MPNRPDSDFDTDRLGQELLDYAYEYRRTRPAAKLSEIADEHSRQQQNHVDWLSNLSQRANGKHNGSRSLG